MGDCLWMQAAASQDANAVLGVRNRQIEEFLGPGTPRLIALFDELNAGADVIQCINYAQERCNRNDLRSVQYDAASGGTNQKLSRR